MLDAYGEQWRGSGSPLEPVCVISRAQVFSLAHGSIHREITSGGAAPRPPAAEAAQEASLKRSGGKSRFNSEGHVLKCV